MNWISLIGPAMVAAGVSGAIAVVGSIVTTRTVRRLRADRLEFDFAPAAHKLNLDKTLAAIKAALPDRLRETAYAIACDLIAAGGKGTQEELQILELIRERLEIGRLAAAAIERGARARFRKL